MVNNKNISLVKKKFLKLDKPQAFAKNREKTINQRNLARALPHVNKS